MPGSLVNGALVVAKTAEHLLAGTLLTIFAVIFMLIDGELVWGRTVRLFPRGTRASANGAGRAGWHTLTSLVRVQILVAAGKGLGIALFAIFLGLPMVVPTDMIVFLGSFIPVVGAIIPGALFAVPLVAVVNPMAVYLASRPWRHDDMQPGDQNDPSAEVPAETDGSSA